MKKTEKKGGRIYDVYAEPDFENRWYYLVRVYDADTQEFCGKAFSTDIDYAVKEIIKKHEKERDAQLMEAAITARR